MTARNEQRVNFPRLEMRGVELSVAPGEVMSLVSENGAGKIY